MTLMMSLDYIEYIITVKPVCRNARNYARTVMMTTQSSYVTDKDIYLIKLIVDSNKDNQKISAHNLI